MAGKEITQEVEFKASAKDVYDALMDSAKHAEFTKAAANIDDRVEGKFSVWDGYATGKNVDLEPGKKIVQTWRASDWPEGENSKLTIDLIEKDGVTTLKLHQTGVPEKFYDDVASGWDDYYWEPLKDYLEK